MKQQPTMGLNRIVIEGQFIIVYDHHFNQLFISILLQDGREVNRAEITPADLMLLGVKICPST